MQKVALNEYIHIYIVYGVYSLCNAHYLGVTIIAEVFTKACARFTIP